VWRAPSRRQPFKSDNNRNYHNTRLTLIERTLKISKVFESNRSDVVEGGLPAEVRQQRTHEYLNQRGFVRVRELSDRFGVSTVTARNDLQALEERNMAQRVHGGAMPANRSRGERPFEEVATQHADEKFAIAAAAAQLVSSGESILIDVGTTAAAFASALVARTDLSDLNVITNGITIALILEAAHPRFSIVVTGGTLRPKQHSLVDPLAGSMLQTLSVDTVFLGCNGIHPDAGVTNINLPEAEIKRTMIAASQRCVVLADSTKFGTRALAPVCAIDDVDVVVTDSNATEEDLDALRERGVDIVVT
jgi:DeoR family transcriptional regulator, aga operon transcriptional repressor